MVTEKNEKTKTVHVRLAVGLIKQLDQEVIRVNNLQREFSVPFDRSKFIRRLIKKELGSYE